MGWKVLNGGQTMGSDLVSIGARRRVDEKEGAAVGSEVVAGGSSALSRRSFLKVIGAGSAVGVAGCADKATQTVFPYVKGEPEQVPGVAVWYRSTCTECSAGCGIQVRTREGRAVKVEGNASHAINGGGLCALGQSSLQSMYDPDRVRQPLIRSSDGKGRAAFKPISWAEAYAKVGEAIRDTDGKRYFVTGEQTGAIQDLTAAFCTATKTEQVTYDPLQPVALAQASEIVFGEYGIPHFSFADADVVLNFGADFLETWISPVEFARGWAKARRRIVPMRLIHIEPRLSLTGANADTWLSANPGSELVIAQALIADLLRGRHGVGLDGDTRAAAERFSHGVTLADAAAASGISFEKISVVAQLLGDAKAPLVIAGGTAASTTDPLPLQVAAALLNLIAGAVGKTVRLGSMRKPKSSVAKMIAMIEAFNKGSVGVVFVHSANPSFSLPSSYGFKYAIKNAKFVVSFSSHFDETTEAANIILPSNHGLESWGDSRPMPGVYSLLQPVMSPVFDTKSLGDSLIEIAAQAGASGVGGGAKSFEAYLKQSWGAVHEASGIGGNFEAFWVSALEQGGVVIAKERNRSAKAPGRIDLAKIAQTVKVPKSKRTELLVFPYYSVRTFDGRAANRPWLHELPDPVTKVVWDSWAEINPVTAKRLGIAEGDMVTVRTTHGEVNLPAYLSKFVHRGIVALPVGNGHRSYGRYAQSVGGGNSLDLLSVSQGQGVSLLGTTAKVMKGVGRAKVVILQGSDSQQKRDLAQSVYISANGEEKGAAGHHAGHHEPKQMYQQREHPLYKWGMAIDLNACTGCSACVVACYAENNIAVVGKEQVWKGREMSWLRIERYVDGSSQDLQVSFLPMMCQHCGNAPCEPVCPVYATYHNEEGLNAMVYNRCVGTRYCSNNCVYKVRRFNWFEYNYPEPLTWQLNPDVTRRTTGIMEKCTFCVQRITEAKDRAKDAGSLVKDGDVQPACVQSCPTEALAFGNLNDPHSRVSRLAASSRAYKVLDHHLNTQPAVSYLKRVRYQD